MKGGVIASAIRWGTSKFSQRYLFVPNNTNASCEGLWSQAQSDGTSCFNLVCGSADTE